MRLEKTELPNDILKVTLIGPLDIAGAAEIDLPFNVIAGHRNKVIVDFTNVSFLASIGIRVLVKVARTLANKRGHLVVFNPTEEARKVLRSTGVDSMFSVVADEAAAITECTR